METVLQHSSRERHPTDRWVSYEASSIEYRPYLFALQHEHEPVSYKQASNDHQWIEAMNKEMAPINKIVHERSWIDLLERILSITNGFTKLKGMKVLRDIRIDW